MDGCYYYVIIMLSGAAGLVLGSSCVWCERASERVSACESEYESEYGSE